MKAETRPAHGLICACIASTIALSMTGTLPADPPGNDQCANATVITEGTTPFSTLEATAGGPDLPQECDEGFGLEFAPDVWFSFVPDADGSWSISTCNDADFDTRMALYTECEGSFIACNDDGIGCSGFTSLMQTELVSGQQYLIRVGGFGDATGTGNLTISFEESTSCFQEHFEPGCDDPACQKLVCAIDPMCCTTSWAAPCVILALENCDLAGAVCGEVDSGSCCEDNGSPGCEDSECCEQICQADLFCCENEWDQICAELALTSCQSCQPGNCTQPSCSFQENEQCKDDINGGCNSGSEPVTPISIGDTVCGEFWADDSSRDTDWYSFELTEIGQLSWTVHSDVATVVFILDDQCPPSLVIEGDGQSCPNTASTCLQPGSYRVFVATSGFDGVPCDSTARTYAATLSLDPDGCPDCGNPASGECCAANGTPYCDDSTCCDIICTQDAFCCEVSWDEFCAGQASIACEPCNLDTCKADPGSLLEEESCGEQVNDGCSQPGQFVQQIPFGSTIDGTFWADLVDSDGDGILDQVFNDYDFYEFTLEGEQEIAATLYGSALSELYLIDDTCVVFNDDFEDSIIQTGFGHCPIQLQAVLPAGTYQLVVKMSPNLLLCDAGQLNEYTLSIDEPMILPTAQDECADAEEAGLGDFPFSTLGATNVGPELPPECDEGFGVQMGPDVWFKHVATCDGTITVSTCGQADFDTRLAVYSGECADLQLVGCNDDAPGCPGVTSEVSFVATCNQVYLVRIGSYGETSIGGIGSLTISCDGGTCADPCPADFNGDNQVDGEDLGVLLGAFGTSNPVADINGDLLVDGEDLGVLLGGWGLCP